MATARDDQAVGPWRIRDISRRDRHVTVRSHRGDADPGARHELVSRAWPGGHAANLAWPVYVMLQDDPDTGSSASTGALVYVVSLADAETPWIGSLVAELRHELRAVITAGPEAFARSPVAGVVYLIPIPRAVAGDQLEDIVSWSALAEPRPGLVAVVPNGRPTDAETALAAGFDDVVVGALSMRELAGRLRAVHRRVHWKGLSRPGRIRHGEMTLDLDSHELWVHGETIQVTGTELAVLRTLIRARGRTLTRSDILDTAWSDDELEISERAVDNVILRLRRKLPRPELIQTVRGVGFRIGD
jgi:DNA-binding response OmpR family regulator